MAVTLLLSASTSFSQTWASHTGAAVSLQGIAVIDALTAVAVGSTYQADRITRKTTDGGATWVSQAMPGDSWAMKAVCFTDANHGTAIGDLGYMMRTANGGTTWTSQPNPAYDGYVYLYGLSFVDANNGATVGQYGYILHTTNGGDTWVLQTSNTSENLYGVSFADVNYGMACGSNGVIVKTTDAGTTWAVSTSGTGNHLLGISYLTENIASVAGFSGTLLRTTDGGATWTAQTNPVDGRSSDFRALCFTDVNNGTAVGDVGKIIRTVNGGANWSIQNSGTSNHLQAVSFCDANNGMVLDMNGNVLTTANGALPVELSDFSSFVDAHGIVLHWTTATEINNSGFEIERKDAGIVGSWKTLGFVKGAGASSIQHSYSFTDREQTAGHYSYRLKQMDRDGAYTYSRTVEAEIAASQTLMLDQNFPNPFNPTTSIRFQLPTAGHASLKVFDVLGNLTATLVDEDISAGTHSIQFDASHLASGMYFYQLKSGSFIETKKIVLAR